MSRKTASGSLNGSSLTTGSKPSSERLPPLANKNEPKKKDSGSALGQFGQLVHASRRPLPVEYGDGQYPPEENKTGLRQDLKYIGWKG